MLTSTFVIFKLMMILSESTLIGNALRLTNMSAPLVADVRGDIDLDCRFDMGAEELYAVKWYKDDREFFRYMPKQHPKTIKFPVVGINLEMTNTNCGKDHCKVKLRGLSREHSGGAFRCEISSEAPTFRLASETHVVTVAALPKETPHIEGVNGPYTEGDVINANCMSDVADPTPILSWYINNQEVLPRHVGEMTCSDPDNRGLMARSLTLSFPVDKKHALANSVELKCIATLPGIPQPPQSTSKLVSTRSRQPEVINKQKLQSDSTSAATAAKNHVDFTIFVMLCFANYITR
ncbi:uncharacterized protein [Atheta coriaria]|uniref:uncharacterized protein n=1 Tax=Dalotia coriaria TaxID=877792 RepID=UPI0031F4579E